MSEERSEYRVTPDCRDAIVLSVADGERCVRGHLLDLSGQGAGIAFPARTIPRISVGDVVTLLMDMAGFGQPIMVPSFVRNRINGKGAVRFGFEFIDSSFQELLPPEVRRFFNRRGTKRADVGQDRPIEITVECEDVTQPIRVAMSDLSVNGVSFVSRAKLFVGSEVDISFELPETPGVMRFSGVLRHRTVMPDDGGYRFGIAFLPEDDEEFDRQQRAIAGFIRSFRPASAPAQG